MSGSLHYYEATSPSVFTVQTWLQLGCVFLPWGENKRWEEVMDCVSWWMQPWCDWFNGAELGFSLLSVEKGKDVSRIVHVYWDLTGFQAVNSF